MTGLSVTDKETGKCVSISLSTLECAIGKPEMLLSRKQIYDLVVLHLTKIS